MSKQTAVEWLEKICNDRGYHLMEDYFKQAKAMERKQIENAYYDGQSMNAKSVTSQMIIDNSISYYNEIYKGGEQ